jgi:(S)-ureidoglycine-glyoxylate aminotransferase
MKPRYSDLSVSKRTILTPGPVEVDPRVLRALATPILGQFDPEFTALMNETSTMIRDVFRTTNQRALPVNGSSRAGIEAALTAVISPGDRVLVPVFGRFGNLLVEIAERLDAQLDVLTAAWGTVFDPAELARHIVATRPSVVAIVHGETSTGRVQPLEGLGDACREVGALLVVDAVATLSGVPFETDLWKVDVAVAGAQKCLSVPCGMAPVTWNDRADAVIRRRHQVERGLRTSDNSTGDPALPVKGATIRSNYLDLAQISDYWSPARLNHHTETTTMLYALREGLRLVLEEGLPERWERHRLHEKALVAGVRGLGLELYGDSSCKLPVVTCVRIPAGLDGEALRAFLLDRFGVEIASSFGPLKGQIWRIGTMGYSASRFNVLHGLGALEAALTWFGLKVPAGAAVQAALKAYEGS